MTSQYYIRIRGRVLGPFDELKLQNLALRGQFGRMHEVSLDGVAWERASQHQHLFRNDPGPSDGAAAQVVPDEPATAASRTAAAPRGGMQAPPEPAPQPADWLYSRNGEQFGPFTLRHLQSMVAVAQLLPADLVWTKDMSEWTPVANVPALAYIPAASASSGADDRSIFAATREPLSAMAPWLTSLAILGSISAAVAILIGIACLVSAAKSEAGAASAALMCEGVGVLLSGILLLIPAYLFLALSGTLRECLAAPDDAKLLATLDSLRRLIMFWGVVTIGVFAILIIGAVVLLAIV